LVGIGSVQLWRVRYTWFASAVLAATLAVTAVWAWFLLDRSPGWHPWLRAAVLVTGVAAAVIILAARALRPYISRTRRTLASVPVPLALIAALGGPLAYSVDTSATTHTGAIPSAGPAVAESLGVPVGQSGFPGGTEGRVPAGTSGGFGGQASISAALSKLLESGASGYRWAAATISSTSAASMELASDGVPVMAIGGFSGSDPAPSLAEFETLATKLEIHYFVNGGGPGGFAGPSAPASSGAAYGAERDLPGGFAGPGGAGGGS